MKSKYLWMALSLLIVSAGCKREEAPDLSASTNSNLSRMPVMEPMTNQVPMEVKEPATRTAPAEPSATNTPPQ